MHPNHLTRAATWATTVEPARVCNVLSLSPKRAPIGQSPQVQWSSTLLALSNRNSSVARRAASTEPWGLCGVSATKTARAHKAVDRSRAVNLGLGISIGPKAPDRLGKAEGSKHVDGSIWRTVVQLGTTASLIYTYCIYRQIDI